MTASPAPSACPRFRIFFTIGIILALVALAALAALNRAPAPDAGASAEVGVTWYCTMTICGVFDRPAPGKCPKCGMDLVPTENTGPKTGPREIALTRDARKLLRVETALVERRAVSTGVDLNGKVAIDETRRSVITARFAGRLERLYVDHTGIPVRAGDHMVDIYAPDLIVSQTSLIRALADQRDGTGTGLARHAGTDVEDARRRLLNWGLSAEQIAEIERRGAPMDTFTINAPIGGVVLERFATRGQYVNEGTPLFAVGDLSRVWVELSAFESDLAPLRHGQTAVVRVPALPGRVFEGVIVFIDPLLDERTRSVRVRLDVPNPDGALKPGMLAKARVEAPLSDDGLAAGPDYSKRFVCPMHPGETSETAGNCSICGMALVPASELGLVDAPRAGAPLVAPASAFLDTGRRTVAYVEHRDAEGEVRYEAREVQTGLTAGVWRVVLSGLAEGERVVTRGNFQLDSAMQIQGKFSLMSSASAEEPEVAEPGGATAHAAPPDPYFGEGGHDGDPQPGWYAVAERSAWAFDAPAWSAATDDLFAVYLRVGEALARDDDPSAGEAARIFAALPMPTPPEGVELAASEFEAYTTLREAVATRARALADAENLATRRVAFRDLSGALATWARRFGASSGGLPLVFCPMAFGHAGAFWLQRSETVNNPYHGLEMPRCGWVVETIPE